MKNLEGLINQAKVAYYNGKPFITDEVYDRLEEQLKLKTVGTSTDENRYPHAYQMYSLQKVYNLDEQPRYPSDASVIVSPKLDGAAVSLQYIRGELSLALTRGDGKRGVDITQKMRYLAPCEIWNEMAESTKVMQITGEVVAPNDIENARNYAAGSLNLKDINEFRNRDLTFIAYGVQPYPTDNFIHDMDLLNSWGFETILDSNYYMFPQDGDVWRVVQNDIFEELGYTSHHPRGAFAKKKKAQGVMTKLLDVVWQVGKSGCVSPVGILEPIKIGDATVSRATLHNMAIIEALDLEIGCTVEVVRAGEIIPQIVARIY